MVDSISQRQARLMAERPRPLFDAAATVTRVTATIGTVVTMLVGWGVVSVVQQDAIEGLLGAIPGVVTLVTSVLAAFGVVRRAEPEVTPLSSPRDNDGRALTPAE